MIQQDYFLRLIEEFAVALAKMLKVNLDKRDDALMDLYRQYVGDYTLVRNLSFEELLDYATKEWNDRERIERLEMVAELLYAEASYKAKEDYILLALHIFHEAFLGGASLFPFRRKLLNLSLGEADQQQGKARCFYPFRSCLTNHKCDFLKVLSSYHRKLFSCSRDN